MGDQQIIPHQAEWPRENIFYLELIQNSPCQISDMRLRKYTTTVSQSRRNAYFGLGLCLSVVFHSTPHKKSKIMECWMCTFSFMFGLWTWICQVKSLPEQVGKRFCFGLCEHWWFAKLHTADLAWGNFVLFLSKMCSLVVTQPDVDIFGTANDHSYD